MNFDTETHSWFLRHCVPSALGFVVIRNDFEFFCRLWPQHKQNYVSCALIIIIIIIIIVLKGTDVITVCYNKA